MLLSRDRLSGLSRGQGPAWGGAAKYSQMLTALGHSPDILGETERSGKGSAVPGPEQKPSPSLSLPLQWFDSGGQLSGTKTRRHKKSVHIAMLDLGPFRRC